MKKITALLTLSILGLLFVRFRPLEPVVKYYFCYSREVASQPSSQKPKLLYTDVRTVSGDGQKEMQMVIRKFAHFINAHCQSGHEQCTSELNRYYTLEQALQHHDELLAKYKRLGTYELFRVDFQSFE